MYFNNKCGADSGIPFAEHTWKMEKEWFTPCTPKHLLWSFTFTSFSCPAGRHAITSDLYNKCNSHRHRYRPADVISCDQSPCCDHTALCMLIGQVQKGLGLTHLHYMLEVWVLSTAKSFCASLSNHFTSVWLHLFLLLDHKLKSNL